MYNFQKNKTPKNEDIYKFYENLFKTIKNRSKKTFYSEKMQKFIGMREKHGVLWKRYLESAPQNPQLLNFSN